MNGVGTEAYVMLSMVLFLMGAMGVLMRRNAILVFMSVELMLNSANLALVAFCTAMAANQRPCICILCDDSGGGGGSRRAGAYCEHFPRASDYQYR